jgi:hypothetical protein
MRTSRPGAAVPTENFHNPIRTLRMFNRHLWELRGEVSMVAVPIVIERAARTKGKGVMIRSILLLAILGTVSGNARGAAVAAPTQPKKTFTKPTVTWPTLAGSSYAFALTCSAPTTICASIKPTRLTSKFAWSDPAGFLTVSAGTDPSCNGGQGGFLTIRGPATGCIPGQQGIAAKFNGKAVSTGQGVLLGMETETLATIPSDRTRKKLGIGEPVTLTLLPTGLSAITWSNAGGGALDATSGGAVVFTADNGAATPSVTATFAGVPVAVSFTVVEPSSESSIKTSEDSVPAGTQGAGMRLEITIAPTDVSFENVESQEVPGPATSITGYFTSFPPASLNHVPAGWIQIAPGNKKFDHAAFSGYPSPWSAGGFQWIIPIQWRVVGSSSGGTLPNRIQTFSIANSSGNSTVSKLGQAVTRTP